MPATDPENLAGPEFEGGDLKSKHVTRMTIEDVGHFTDAERNQVIASYPLHEREARARGIPIMGSGMVYPVAEDLLRVPQITIPDHWPRIGGLDFGWRHPTAAVELAWDRDADVIYVCKVYAQKEATPIVHTAAIKPWGKGLPFAWPHDGLQKDKGSGVALAQQYRDAGLDTLAERATFIDGSSGVEAGVQLILDRMLTGRFKVFDHLERFFSELRLYHRKEGLIVKEMDDVLDACRYAVMMLRFARTPPTGMKGLRRRRRKGWMGR